MEGFNEWLMEDTGEMRQSEADLVAREIDTVADGVDAHREYIEDKADARIIVENEATGEVAALPWEHRWTEGYEQKMASDVREAVRELGVREQWMGGAPVTMVTLTAYQTDQYGDPRPPLEVLKDLQAGWEKFRKVIRRETEPFKTAHMKVIGPHRSGYPHIHCVIFGMCLPSLAEKVQELWVEKYGIGGEKAHERAVTAVRNAQVEKPANYIIKNIEEAQWEWEDDHERGDISGVQAFCAMMWISGAKQITMSHGLADALAAGSASSAWNFIGTTRGVEPGVYAGETARQIAEAVKSGLLPKPPPDKTADSAGPARPPATATGQSAVGDD